jgi:hypothetical protein
LTHQIFLIREPHRIQLDEGLADTEEKTQDVETNVWNAIEGLLAQLSSYLPKRSQQYNTYDHQD